MFNHWFFSQGLTTFFFITHLLARTYLMLRQGTFTLASYSQTLIPLDALVHLNSFLSTPYAERIEVYKEKNNKLKFEHYIGLSVIRLFIIFEIFRL